MNIFNRIVNFFKRLFSKETGEAIERALDKAAPYVAQAMPIVERIAAITPWQTDDEILRAYREYDLEYLFDPSKDRKVLLRDLAVAAIRGLSKDVPSTSLLNLAVELAVNALKDRNSITQDA